MSHIPFDPKPVDPMKAVHFDLAHGQVRLGGPSPADAGKDSGRAVIVPVDALLRVSSAAGPGPTRELGRSLGHLLGARVAGRLSGVEGVRVASIEDVVTEVATEVAVTGLGEIALERWGRALVLAVAGAPAGAEALVAAVLEALLASATGAGLSALPLTKGGEPVRVLIASAAATERVWRWLEEGVAWGDALARLHSPRGEVSA